MKAAALIRSLHPDLPEKMWSVPQARRRVWPHLRQSGGGGREGGMGRDARGGADREGRDRRG